MKTPNQFWQRCRACGTEWPVHADFADTDVEVECPHCHETAPFSPLPTGSAGPLDDS